MTDNALYDYVGGFPWRNNDQKRGSHRRENNTNVLERSNSQECEAGYVPDCSGDGDCCLVLWIGDGWGDCAEEEYGCDLSCYENDGGDCSADTFCGNGFCNVDETYTDCPEDCVSPGECNTGYIELNSNCLYQSDLDVLQKFIDNSLETINMNQDEHPSV